jgi:hypothetical protein
VRHKTLRLIPPAALLATTGLLGAPQSASAADFSFTLPGGTACSGFDLGVSGSGGNSHTKTFLDADGNPVRTITAGTGSALTFTNMLSGKTLSLRSNGAVQKNVFNADGTTTTTLTGHNVLILFPTDLPAGPSTTLIVGRTVFNVDAGGVFRVQSVAGDKREICTELAP